MTHIVFEHLNRNIMKNMLLNKPQRESPPSQLSCKTTDLPKDEHDGDILKKRANSYLHPRQLVKEAAEERENKQNSNKKAAKLNMHSQLRK